MILIEELRHKTKCARANREATIETAKKSVMELFRRQLIRAADRGDEFYDVTPEQVEEFAKDYNLPIYHAYTTLKEAFSEAGFKPGVGGKGYQFRVWW